MTHRGCKIKPPNVDYATILVCTQLSLRQTKQCIVDMELYDTSTQNRKKSLRTDCSIIFSVNTCGVTHPLSKAQKCTSVVKERNYDHNTDLRLIANEPIVANI